MKPPSPTSFFLSLLGFLILGILLTFWLSPETKPPEPDVSLRAIEPSTPPKKAEPPQASRRTEACKSLYAVACGSRTLLEDPTGIVQPDVHGEVEALRVYETIIHQHPTWTSEQVDEQLVKQIYTERRRKRLISTYTWVLQAMQRFIDKQPMNVFSLSAKKQLKQRLRDTVLELPPPAAVYANEPELFTKNDVYYGSFPDGKRVIRVGGAYLLTAKSLFNRIFTFAHELAHAIDPCDLQAGGLVFSAYPKLTECFRRKGLLRKGTDPSPCSSDSVLPEVFADWVASEITAIAIEQYQPKTERSLAHSTAERDVLNSVINSVRDLCAQESWLEEDLRAHPSPHQRIGLFGSHPRIRQLLGCAPAPTEFCSFNRSGK